MKSVLLILTTVTSALAVLVAAIAATQSQNEAAFNGKNNLLNFNSHDHTQISIKHGIKGNDGTVYDDANTHQDDNFNRNRVILSMKEPNQIFITNQIMINK
jgi:hypothetical protein